VDGGGVSSKRLMLDKGVQKVTFWSDGFDGLPTHLMQYLYIKYQSNE